MIYQNIICCVYLDNDDPRQSSYEGIGACGYILVGLSYFLVVISFPFSLCICIKVCLLTWNDQFFFTSFFSHIGCSRIWTSSYSSSWSNYTRYDNDHIRSIEPLILLISGGAKGPGLFFILPCVDTIVKVDLRTATFNVPPQEVSFWFLSWNEFSHDWC